MVNNSNACRPEFRALLSLNHAEVAPQAIEAAAFGVIVRYYLKRAYDGVKAIFADFENVPAELADLLRFYPNRSIDLFPTYRTQTRRLLRNVIAGVAFLGAKMPPAVKAMFPDFAISYAHNPAVLALQAGRQTFNLMEAPMTKRYKTDPAASDAGATPPAANPPATPPAEGNVAELLKSKRAELGVTEADIAKAVNDGGDIGVSEQTIKDLEAGLVAPCLPDFITRLAAAYGVDAAIFAPPAAKPKDAAEPPAPAPTDAALMRQMLNEEFAKFAQAAKTGAPAAPAKTAGQPDLRAQVQNLFADMLNPIQAQVAELAQARNAERDQRKAQEIAHFMENLETTYHASKALTGDAMRKLLAAQDDTRKIAFAEGAKTPRQMLMASLEALAKAGTVTVPVGQITDQHGRRKFEDQTQVQKIEQFQRDRKISRYGAAMKLYLREQQGGNV